MNHNFDIPGMMSERELNSLASIASLVPPNGTILEIGIYLGRTTHALYTGKHTSVRLTSIDSWTYMPIVDNANIVIKGSMSLFYKAAEISKEKGSMRAGFELCNSDIVDDINVIQADSRQHNFDTHYNFVFVDGDHDYESVNADIKKHNYSDTLIMGDDYLRQFEGVIRACNENRNGKTLIIPGGDDIKLWALVPQGGYWKDKAADVFKILNSMN